MPTAIALAFWGGPALASQNVQRLCSCHDPQFRALLPGARQPRQPLRFRHRRQLPLGVKLRRKPPGNDKPRSGSCRAYTRPGHRPLGIGPGYVAAHRYTDHAHAGRIQWLHGTRLRVLRSGGKIRRTMFTRLTCAPSTTRSCASTATATSLRAGLCPRATSRQRLVGSDRDHIYLNSRSSQIAELDHNGKLLNRINLGFQALGISSPTGGKGLVAVGGSAWAGINSDTGRVVTTTLPTAAGAAGYRSSPCAMATFCSATTARARSSGSTRTPASSRLQKPG